MSSFWNILSPKRGTEQDAAPPMVRLGIRAAGLCCAVGYHLSAAACAIRANMDHFQESEFQSRLGDALLVARLPETQLWGQARLARWLELAIADCLQHAPELDTRNIPLLWIAPQPGRNGATHADADDRKNGQENASDNPDLDWYAEVFDLAVKQLGKQFHPSSAVLPQGRAGLAAALAQAMLLVQDAQHPYVLLAGVDSYLDAATINHYLQDERLQVPGNSDGFIPGEAAAAVLLHKVDAHDVGVHITGYGQGQEAGRPDGSVPSRAQGLSQAVRAALASSRQHYDDLAFRISDQNGEAFFAREAANAMTRVAPTGGQKLPLLTMADCLGEIGAATGPAMLAYLARLMPHHASPGHNALLHLANDNGLRCAVVLHYQPS
jgi:3-oxoacyl-[acyl-carrier-protein] synthase-1